MRFTVYEQASIPVRAAATVASDVLDPGQASRLVEYCEGVARGVVSWQTPSRLRTGQYVGEVQADDICLELLPKIEGLPEPARVRQSLLGMLAVAEDLQVRSSEVVGFLESDEPFVRALARLYCRRLLELVRRGLRQEYVGYEETLPYVRGKVDWVAHARLCVKQRLEFPCQYDERSEDTLLNRTLKAALLQAETLLAGSKDSSIATELRHALGGIANIAPASRDVERLTTDRVSREFGPVLVLAKLILGQRSPDLGRPSTGNRRTYALIWDMNVLFEEYVGRTCAQALESRGLRVDLQARASTYLATEMPSRAPAFRLRPDILVRDGRAALAVVDTKWKRLNPRTPDWDISPSDIYQVLTYAHRYDIDQAILVYPHHPALGSAGPKRVFITKPRKGAGVSVRLVTVDLSRLDRVPDQLRSGILGTLEAGAA